MKKRGPAGFYALSIKQNQKCGLLVLFASSSKIVVSHVFQMLFQQPRLSRLSRALSPTSRLSRASRLSFPLVPRFPRLSRPSRVYAYAPALGVFSMSTLYSLSSFFLPYKRNIIKKSFPSLLPLPLSLPRPSLASLARVMYPTCFAS